MEPKAGFLTGSIKSLPEDVRSSVRSGIFLSDLTRVVEELVYNSLDAGATKVSVWVSMGTCYIKVVDDGAGISRDGLGLLGERYATSKCHHNGDLDAADGSFGSRGEALASISDVSLLEVVTKAYGRPNGYRKVIKGSKCLYVGIDDDRRDVGTTVIVRDLFYNQPVRRKCIQSSPKKVLHSVKKCVLRIALVHPKVSFKVFDIESENELLCTHPSTSPLPLLMSCFGIEDSSSFQELNVSDGELMLTGYISGPCSSFPIKVFQYAYINSRFTCKGPIHKLVNHLATEFEDLDLWKVNSESQRGKKTKPLACPAYIVNLNCPQSLYDLTFESSKTCVEFKDWVPVLTFIEKAILHFWRKTVGHGESFLQATDIEKDERQQAHGIKCAEDFSGNTNFAMRKCGIHNNQISLDLPSPPSKILSKGSNNLFQRKPEQNLFQDLHKNISQLDRQPTEKEFVGQTHYAFQSLDGPLAKCTSDMPQRCHESYGSLWIPDTNLCLTEDYSPRNMFTAVEIFNDHAEDNITSSTWQNKSSEVEPYDGSIGSSFSLDFHEFSDDAEISKDIQKPLLQSCYSQERLSLDGAIFANDEELEPQIQFQDEKMKRKRAFPDYMSNISDVEIGSRRFDFYSRTSWPDGMATDFDLRPGGSEKWFLSDGDNNLSYHSYKPIRNSSSYHNSFKSDWSPLAFKAEAWNVENCPSENALTGSSRPSKRTNYGYCPDGEPKDCRSSYEIINYCYRDSCTAFCTKAPLDFQDYDGFDSDFRKSRKRHKQYNKISQEKFDMKTDKTGWLSMDSSGEDNTGADKYERQRHLKSQAHAHTSKARSMRSQSAPPFYREKKRFISLNFHLMMEAGNTSGGGELKPSDKPSGMYNVQAKPNLEVDISPNIRSEMKIDDIRQDPNDVHKDENLEQSILLQFNDTAPLQDFSSADSQDSPNSESKWRNSFPQIATNKKSLESHISNNILNISSGFLHLAGDSLIPESISKSYLKDAKVLQQVDKKFIPVISGGILAVIDQHAADERIRLEELREKVLSGEARTTAYLDAEKELVLPEIGYQLLDNYAEQIKDWGWICNIHAQDSRSFKKNMDLMHRRPTVVTLLAVPCILGVKLSDVDLLEFIQQLSDTDGSSTIPPSVLKVLNYKACRGAIMFGDSLLPSECSLIVEELKQTSLCFQCAHGRPTTVPLVNLVALRKQIPKLGLSNERSNEPWHGLRRQELSLERTVQRLRSAI